MSFERPEQETTAGSSLTPEQVEQMKEYEAEVEKAGLKEQRIPQEVIDAKKGRPLTPEQVEQVKSYLESLTPEQVERVRNYLGEEAEKWGLRAE